MKKLTITKLSGLIAALSLSVLPAVYAQSTPGDAGSEPEKSMTAAHECFLKKDVNGASKHVHHAAVVVKEDSEKVAEDAKGDMKKAGDELDKLGEGIKDGTVKSDQEVKKTFARVNHQIANCWHKTAEASKKSGKDAGVAIQKAGAGLANAAKWSGHKLSEGAQASVDGIKKAGGAVGKGVKTGADDVGKWFKGLGEGIKDLGQKL